MIAFDDREISIVDRAGASAGPQGRKGEVLASLTDFPNGSRAATEVSGGARFAGRPLTRVPLSGGFRLPVGKNEGAHRAALCGEPKHDLGAETLAGMDVIVPSEERVALDDKSTYISEYLIGCTVYDVTTRVGVVADV